jgi:peptidoglycan-N-acetylglucosamine deacetylase
MGWPRLSVRRVLLTLVACALLLLLLVWGSWQLLRSRSYQLFGELATVVETEERVVALTFDDGPIAPHTDSILELLRAEGVPATFFVIGSNVAKHPHLARRILAEGHELGNHTYTHRRMVLVSQRVIREEVERTDSLIREAGARGPIHFRPPYGSRLVGLPWYLARTGRSTVLWTLEPDSWFSTHEDMTRHVLEEARPGAIILLHVEVPSRVEERRALRQIIDGLQERGYGFVTVSSLLAHNPP